MISMKNHATDICNKVQHTSHEYSMAKNVHYAFLYYASFDHIGRNIKP
jgi:hypothetical protein